MIANDEYFNLDDDHENKNVENNIQNEGEDYEIENEE